MKGNPPSFALACPHYCLIQAILGFCLGSGSKFPIFSIAGWLISLPSKQLTKLVLLKHKSILLKTLNNSPYAKKWYLSLSTGHEKSPRPASYFSNSQLHLLLFYYPLAISSNSPFPHSFYLQTLSIILYNLYHLLTKLFWVPLLEVNSKHIGTIEKKQT